MIDEMECSGCRWMDDPDCRCHGDKRERCRLALACDGTELAAGLVDGTPACRVCIEDFEAADVAVAA